MPIYICRDLKLISKLYRLCNKFTLLKSRNAKKMEAAVLC